MEQKPKPVLVADDQSMNQKLFSVILDKLGYDCILAGDGEEAVVKALSKEPVLVFMDIQMPKMNGYEASKNLRDRGFKNPIIAVTAGDPMNEQANYLNAGIDDILTKPVKKSDIEKMLEKWINVRHEASGNFAQSPVQNNQNPASSSVVFDSAGMLETFMHDEATALPLISRFIERTRLQLENIPALKEAGDWESARREAHTIRGAAFTIGGMELGNAAANLEQACKNASKEETEIAYPPALRAYMRFKKEAEEFINARK